MKVSGVKTPVELSNELFWVAWHLYCSCGSLNGFKGTLLSFLIKTNHGLRTLGEEIAFTARPKIKSQSQIFRYGRSIFCLPHWPNFSDIFDLCLHWVSVVRGIKDHEIWTFIVNFLCLAHLEGTAN